MCSQHVHPHHRAHRICIVISRLLGRIGGGRVHREVSHVLVPGEFSGSLLRDLVSNSVVLGLGVFPLFWAGLER
eukprot:11226533-Lingulodinium_polyedra.AAC.1